MERLQKVIANLGYTSRRHAEELILLGQVKVDGEVITELGYKVKKQAKIEVEGVILDNNKTYEYYLLNKPKGVVTTTHDEKGRKTVVDLIATETRIYPIGRLDYDTTGLLLLTNDGTLTNLLNAPKSNIDKTYIAKINNIVKLNDIKKLRDGVIINNIKTSRAKVKLKSIDRKNNTSILEIVIHEGRNHQVKKMFESLGYQVLKLKREKYANLDLKGVSVGSYRRLTPKEVTTLYSLVKK